MYLPVLWVINRIIIIYAWLLLYNLSLSATAGHSTAQEYVDQQHDTKQDTKGYTEPGQPGWVGGADAVGTETRGSGWSRLRYVDRGRYGYSISSLDNHN